MDHETRTLDAGRAAHPCLEFIVATYRDVTFRRSVLLCGCGQSIIVSDLTTRPVEVRAPVYAKPPTREAAGDKQPVQAGEADTFNRACALLYKACSEIDGAHVPGMETVRALKEGANLMRSEQLARKRVDEGYGVKVDYHIERQLDRRIQSIALSAGRQSGKTETTRTAFENWRREIGSGHALVGVDYGTEGPPQVTIARINNMGMVWVDGEGQVGQVSDYLLKKIKEACAKAIERIRAMPAIPGADLGREAGTGLLKRIVDDVSKKPGMDQYEPLEWRGYQWADVRAAYARRVGSMGCGLGALPLLGIGPTGGLQYRWDGLVHEWLAEHAEPELTKSWGLKKQAVKSTGPAHGAAWWQPSGNVPQVATHVTQAEYARAVERVTGCLLDGRNQPEGIEVTAHVAQWALNADGSLLQVEANDKVKLRSGRWVHTVKHVG